MKRIGITGGIGSGKSEVTGLLRRKGYAVIDADEVSRESAIPGEPAMLRLREELNALGGDLVGIVFNEDGSLDRKASAKLMFSDPSVLEIFNRIFHEDIWRRIEAAALKMEEAGKEVVFVSAALLFEAGGDRKVDEVWLITADEGLRISRTKQRDGLSEADVRARMATQMPEEEKRLHSDVIIENNGTVEELYAIVEEQLAKDAKAKES